MSVVQPPRKTELIVTEILNKEHPEKPAVIETTEGEVQMMAKDGFADQKIALAKNKKATMKMYSDLAEQK
jgi:hypothetical protein